MDLSQISDSPLTSFCMFVLCLLLARTVSGKIDPQYQACVTKTCGDGQNISYPFYIENQQEAYCGFPGFNLSCNDKGNPVLKLSGDTSYIVEKIFNDNQSVLVSNAAVSETNSNGACTFPRIKNVSLTAEFQLAPDHKQVVLLYNCNNSLPEKLLRHKLLAGNCSSDDTVLGMFEDDSDLDSASNQCNESAVAPVAVDMNGEGMIDNIGIEEMVRKGFLLKWKASDCSVCKGSGGKCGFEEDTFHFQCYCPDRPHAKHCTPVLSIASKYEACKPRNCGNGPNISYPFFIRGAGADFCGYPGFQIHCKQDNPIYKISKGYFSIQDISYENQSFRLVDEGLFNDSCVAPVHNFSFDRSSLDFSLYHADLYFFNGCNDSFYVNHTKSKVTCASNATHSTFVALAPRDEGLNWSTIACDSLVASPVQLEAEEINRTIESFNYVKLLKDGFALKWTGYNCAECRGSGGQCGFEEGNSVCFCPDGSHSRNCNDAQEQRRFNQSCSSFSCGKFRNINFPYFKRTHPECGFCLVDDWDKPVQKIQLGKDEPWFYVTSISQDRTVTLYDQVFQKHLDNRSCESFKNISLPSSPSISFEILSNLTLFKCPTTLDNIPMNFSLPCDDSMIYYNHPDDDDLPSLPPQCSLIQLPVAVNKTSYRTDLFDLLTGNFSLKIHPDWHARRQCINCPSRGEGQCLIKSKGYFQCSDGIIATESDGHEKLKLKLGLGLGGGSIALVALLSCIIYYHRRQKYASANIHSGDNSSGPSSKSDLETGTVYFSVPIFSYNDLAEATNDFNREKELGDGGFGTVYYGKLKDGREVAVKRLYEHNYRRVEQFMNEVEILTRLRHKNLVSLFGCTSRYSQGLLLVYEFVPNGTLADQLRGDRAKHGLLTWPIRMNIAIETASALAYLHASDIIHRDVKTNNILLDSNFCVKVADFGLSRLFPLDVTHISTAPQGTPGYVDPEYHQCYQLTDKSDVYSFGVVLIELISSMPAVDMNRHRHEINLANLAINKIQKCAFDELIDPRLGYESDEEIKRMTTSVAELAFLCLQQEKELRPSMEEVLAELERIKSGESKFENQDDNEGIKSTQPPPSPPYCEEDSLLKNIRLPPSPISVTAKWVSISSTTPNASG